MHLPRIILVLALAVVSACAEETLPTAYGFSHLTEATLLNASRYRLTFLRSEPDKYYSPMGLFAFRHTLDESIKLWGFGFQKDGSLQVRFERFSKWEGNRWTELPVGYCGTGAQAYALEPNRDYVLRVPLWPFAKTGSRGVVLLHGAGHSLISKEFDGDLVRKGVDKGKAPK